MMATMIDPLRVRRCREAFGLIQVCRAGKSDAEGVLVLDDSRTPQRIHQAGPWRLSDELRAAGTVPMPASGQRRCSIRFKGWVLDHWAAAEFGTSSYRRVIGYHYDEMGRAEKDSKIQRNHNTEAVRTICEPHYPLILAKMKRTAVEAYVYEQLGEKIKKSYCSQCPFSGVCASRDRQEERLREHPHVAAGVLLMEFVSVALSEQMSLYGPAGSLYQRLAEDGRNNDVLTAFETVLDQAEYAVYEVRRMTSGPRTAAPTTAGSAPARSGGASRSAPPAAGATTPKAPTSTARRVSSEQQPWCRGLDGCRGKVKKGQSWRSLRTVWVGDRSTAEMLVLRYASKNANVKLTRGEHSNIRRAHYLLPTDGLPSAEAFLVAAPAGVVDKQRKSFETSWRDITGRIGTVFRPVRELPKPTPKRKKGAPIPIRRAIDTTDVTLTA